jgi:hypothetical protein
MLVWPSTIIGETRILVPTWRDKLFSGSDTSSYTFSAISIGSVPAAGHTRHVVVIAMGVSAGSGSTLTGMELLYGDFSAQVPMSILENFED